MQKKDLTDRELLSRYSNLWLPKKPPKDPTEGQELTETVVAAFMESKEFGATIKHLRHVHKRTCLEDEIEDLVMQIALLKAGHNYDWSEVERKQKQLDKAYEALAEENKTNGDCCK